MRALYICYFGVREPLVQTQVLPYLRELVAGGVEMSLLTFEPRRFDPAEWRERLRAEGIEWEALPYHKRPTLPATLYDIARGAFRAASIARRKRIDIFHGRSHVGAAIGALAKRMRGGRLIFDFRGFLAEEYVSAGRWRAGGWLYRLTKMAERRLLRVADGIVFLTERMTGSWRPSPWRFAPVPLPASGERVAPQAPGEGCTLPYVEVIPCCVDVARFAAADRADLGVRDRLVYVYTGALGGYYLVEETAALLAAARAADPRTFALILTQTPPQAIIAALERNGFTSDDYRVMTVPPAKVPRYLRAADVGISLIRTSFARQASSPTKFAEYLAAGLPVISTAEIGDLDAQIAQHRVGVLLSRFDRDAYAEAIRAMTELRRDSQLAERCRALARQEYDLHDVGGARYRRLYEAVLPEGAAPAADGGRTFPESSPSPGAARHPLPASRGEGPVVRVLALASYPVEAASSRYRIAQFIEPLAERGVEIDFRPFLDRGLFAALYEPRKLLPRVPLLVLRTLGRIAAAFRAARADVVFVQREAMLVGPPIIEWIIARVLRRPIVLDLDDATYIAYASPVYGRAASLLKWPGKTDRLIRWARVVVCGNPNLAAHARSLGAEAVVAPTVVDTRVFRPLDAPPHDVPTIGWIGTHGTFPFLERLLPLFERLGREQRFRLTIVGSGRAEVRVPSVDVDCRPWRLDREADDFRALDIGVYPIANDAWSAGKSGFKAVQYMSCGVPFVMSPVGVCATMGVAGETHFAATTDDEWLAALRQLLADAELRRKMGRAGRAYADAQFSLAAQADLLAEILRMAAC
jgi:glycosyltransferase involved in cell wall biosynthesis